MAGNREVQDHRNLFPAIGAAKGMFHWASKIPQSAGRDNRAFLAGVSPMDIPIQYNNPHGFYLPCGFAVWMSSMDAPSWPSSHCRPEDHDDENGVSDGFRTRISCGGERTSRWFLSPCRLYSLVDQYKRDVYCGAVLLALLAIC
jgi:hypothetical protein